MKLPSALGDTTTPGDLLTSGVFGDTPTPVEPVDTPTPRESGDSAGIAGCGSGS